MCAWHVCACVYNKRMYVSLKYLEIQLNYITAIPLARERSVLQLIVIFVIVSVLFKTTEEGLVGVSYISRGHVRWVSM